MCAVPARAGTGPAEVGSGRDSQGAVPARRSFLGWLLVVGSALVGAALSVPLVRFALHPLLSKTTETTWSEVGNAEDFSSLSSPVRRAVTVEHTDGWRKAVTQRAVYVTQDPSGRLVALSAVEEDTGRRRQLQQEAVELNGNLMAAACAALSLRMGR